MAEFPLCTHCGFTLAEYRTRGLLGCPHCYASFGEALQADLLWLHGAAAFADISRAVTSQMEGMSPLGSVSEAETVAAWKLALHDAVRTESYAEAARLQKLIEGAGRT